MSPNLGTRSNPTPPSDPPPSFDDRVEGQEPTRSTSHPRLTEQQYAEVWRSRQARKNNKPIRTEDLERLRDVVEEDDGRS